MKSGSLQAVGATAVTAAGFRSAIVFLVASSLAPGPTELPVPLPCLSPYRQLIGEKIKIAFSLLPNSCSLLLQDDKLKNHHELVVLCLSLLLCN